MLQSLVEDKALGTRKKEKRVWIDDRVEFLLLPNTLGRKALEATSEGRLAVVTVSPFAKSKESTVTEVKIGCLLLFIFTHSSPSIHWRIIGVIGSLPASPCY